MSDPLAIAAERLHDAMPLLRIAREIHQSDRGGPILFADKPYLIALYGLLPKMPMAVFRKAVQTGISEALIQLMLYKAGWLGQKCAYALPTNPVAARFVTQRINPLIESVPTYRRLLPYGTVDGRKPDVGNVGMKRFGPGSMSFIGAETKSNWVEFSADLLIVDELDLCVPEHVAMAPDRVSASKSPSLVYVGNPTNAGVGIDRMYDTGSRTTWFQRCWRCGHRQALDWFLHFVDRNDDGRWTPLDKARANDPAAGDLRPVCAKCRRPFERDGENALWVHERRPDPPLVPWSFTNGHLDMLKRGQPMREAYIAWVLAQTDDNLLVKFYQSRLGLPKRAEGASLTVEMLRRVATGRPMDPMGETTRGKMLVLSSDVGSTFHVTLSEIVEDMDVPVGYRRLSRWAGTTTSWTGLHAIWDRYQPGITVVDAGPEGTAAREFCARVESKREGAQAYRCAFHAGNRVAGSEMAFHKSTRERLVTVDRTQAMDRAFYDLRDGLHVLPLDILTVPGWSEQMCAPIRQVKPNGEAFWNKGGDTGEKGNDHYRLSDTYNRVGVLIAAKSGCLPSPG